MIYNVVYTRNQIAKEANDDLFGFEVTNTSTIPWDNKYSDMM
jgi:hypothetical protein